MISKDREYRSFDYETREEGMIITGVPLLFEVPTVMYEIDGIKYYEVIKRGALDETDISDVVLNIDHVGKPAAKTRNKTLELNITDEGLSIVADLSKNATGRELFEDIENGFYDKMSFAFTVTEQTYDAETRTREIRKIKSLYDVSAVTKPAYNETSISVRSYFEAEAEKERTEVRKREVLKMRLKYELKKSEGENK